MPLFQFLPKWSLNGRQLTIFLVALIVGLIFILVGIRTTKEPFSGTISTEYIDFTAARAFETGTFGARNIVLSFRGEVTGPISFASDEDRIELHIEAPPRQSGTNTPDALALATIKKFEVPADSQVIVSTDPATSEVFLTIRGAAFDLEVLPQTGAKITAISSLCFQDQNCPTTVYDEDDASLLVSAYEDDDLVLSIEGSRVRQIIAEVVDASEIETWETIDSAVGPFRKSGISEGYLQFASLPNKSRGLLEGEVIEIETNILRLRSLRAIEGGVTFQMSGELANAATFIGNEPVSFMPNWFEKLSNDSRMRYLLGAISLLLALRQLIGWVRTSPEKKPL